jgi:hypothetical protein
MMKILVAVFLFGLIQAEFFERPCRTIEEYGGAVINFNYRAYTGNWYQIER